MLKQLGYAEGQRYLEEIHKNKNFGELQVYQDTDNRKITVKTPGYKRYGDYKLTVTVNGDKYTPTHADICKQLHDYIRSGSHTYEELLDVLEKTYTYGTKNIIDDKKLSYIQFLIFWITLQEEINYPRQKGKQGINLPFSRYYEALHCTRVSTITIEEVCQRCDNHGQRIPECYCIQDAPSFYNKPN